MSAQMDALITAVSRNNTVVESAITLLDGLKTALDQAIASGDPAAIQAVSDSLTAESDKLAAAVAANTPGAPTAARDERLA